MSNNLSILPRLLGVYPSKTDAVSFYRSVGVLPYIRSMQYSILDEPIAWNVLIDQDIVFINRPFGGNFLEALHVMLKNKKQIWLDYDDNFLNIPDTNPVHTYYQNEKHIDEFIQLLESAHVVTVSTHSLGKYFSSVAPKCKPLVIPNAFNDYLFKFEYSFSENKIVNWRGSNTHNQDFRTIIDSFVDVTNKYPNWDFSFLGKLGYHLKGIPIKTTDPVTKKEKLLENPFLNYVNKFENDNLKAFDEMDIIDYFNFLKSLSPSIQIVPLENALFNYNKSNIAWMEATYAGAVTIAPNFPEFRKPGVLLYETEKQFKKILTSCLDGEINLRENYELSFNYIKENLMLSNVNKKREELIHFLFGKVKV